MSEFAVSLLRLSYLLLLWVFVLLALAALRRDVYGVQILRRGKAGAVAGAPAKGRRGRKRSPSPAPPASGPAGRPGVVHGAPSPMPPGAGGSFQPVPQAEAAAWPTRLVVVAGPLAGTSLPLGGGIVIGRSSSANLVLDDEFASGRHARLIPGPDGWVLEDLGSTNGTYLGRQRITGPTPVKAGQTVRIGSTRLELVR
jgi:hypothetical protein